MRIRRHLTALAGMLLVAGALGACGGSLGGAAPEEVASYLIEIQQPFVGHEARDASELEPIVQNALEIAANREGKIARDAEETKQAKRVNEKFKKANASYAEGDYAKAQQRYESILDSYHGHYGANVNLTLALLQQEKADEALAQALACCHIFPDEPEPMLNVQVAGAACGFAAQDVEEALNGVLRDASTSFDALHAKLGDDYDSYYLYNQIWDRIETELHGGAAAEAAEDEAAEEGEAVEAEEAAPADKPAYETYKALGVDLSTLEGELPDDADVAALRAYYQAVGLQLSFEADPSLIEPVHTMPYIAVDSDLCTIRVVEIANNKPGEERLLSLEVTNKTEDTTLSLGSSHTWLVNGGDAVAHLDQVSIAPGETQDATLHPGYWGEDDLTSVAGTITVSSQELNSVLAVYPVSWEAAGDE